MLYQAGQQDVSGHFRPLLNPLLKKSKTVSPNFFILFPTATTASHASSSSVNTTATSATCGCRMKSVLTIAPTVAFAASVGPKTSSTVTTVACALIVHSTTTTTARTASTSQTVPSARNTCSRRDRQVTKCPADMRFTGTAFVS